jgi:hypothetical protein
VSWEVVDPEDVGDAEADLIGFSLGVENQQSEATIHTDLFELSVLYGSFALQKDW